MSGRGYIIGPQIPQGLAVVVEGLAREILRQQPVDIYVFAAHHFEELVKLREKGRLVEIVPQVPTLIDETATIRKLTAPCLTRKLTKKQKETTASCGWSINRTAKVFKKHGFERDDKKKQAERKISDDYSEAHSAGFSKKTIHGRFVRSSSVGDLLGKYIRTEVVDNLSSRGRFVSVKYEYEKHLKRQKSTGQIERSGEFGDSRSVANSTPKWSESDVEERTRWHRARIGSAESTFRRYRRERRQGESKSATNQRNERNKLEEKIRNAEETIAKNFKSRSEKNGDESKNDCVMEKDKEGEGDGDGDGKGECDKKKSIEILNRESRYDLSQIDALESLVVLPSVVAKHCSTRCSPNETVEPDEPADRSNFVLPPILNDSSKLLKKESNLTLPSLSNAKDSVNDIVSNKNSWLTKGRNEYENENENQDRDETTSILEKVENIRYSNSQKTDFEEVFRDSLNVTPDSIEFSPRPDSLEYLQEERGENRSNELKEKLIEIETMEKSIENTLVASEEAVTFNNQLEKGVLVEVEVNSNREPCENVTVSVTETGEMISLKDKETVEEEKPIKDQLALEDGKNDTKDDHKVDTDKGETGKDSNTCSNISSSKDIDTDTDTDQSNVSEPVPVLLSLSLSENSSTKIEPTCYVLTEGSPCEIPESVTTVILPDISFPNDEIIEFQHNTGDSDLERTVSFQTEEFQRDNDPFGDRVCPEAFRSSASIDVDFLRGIKDAVDRTAVCQDLGNIKEEEEESERVKLSDDVTSTSFDDVEDQSETIENKDGNDRDAEVESKVNHGVKVGNVEKCLGESGPYVPELNLDSLRDVTICSFGTTESKNMEDQWIKEKTNEEEHEDVSVREGENTLCSFDTLPSEEKTMQDEGVFPSKNATDQTDDRCTKLRDDSYNIEEEIARELIKNLILETPIVQEGNEIATNDSSTSVSTERKETDVDNVFEPKYNREQVGKERSDHENDTSGSSSAVIFETAVELANILETERCIVEQVPNDSYTQNEAAATTIHCWTRLNSLPQGPSEANELQNRDDSLQTREEVKSNWTSQSGGSGLWHSGEFHDSLPLPLLEVQNIISNKDSEASNNSQTDRIESRQFVVDHDTGTCLVPESLTPQPTLVYAIDLSTDSRSVERKLSFVRSSLNFLPCLVQVVGPVVDDSNSRTLAVVPVAENTRDPNIDDLVREPLVLDDRQPKPSIVIEEISIEEQDRYRDRDDNEDNAIPIYPINDRPSIDDDKLSTNSSMRVFAIQLTDSENIASHQRETEEGWERKEGDREDSQ